MQRSFASLVAIFAGVWLAQLVVNVARLSEVVIVSSAAFVVFLAVVFVRAWRVRLGVADAVISTVVAIVVSASFLTPAEYVPPVGARNNAAVVAGVLLASLLPRRIAWPACLALIVAYLLLSVNIDGVAGSVEALWPVVAAAAAAGAVSWVMRTAAGRADRSGDALLEAKARQAATAGRRAAHQSFQRTLHDDVVSALRAVSTAGLDGVIVRDACVAALRAASRAPEPVDPDQGTDLSAALAVLSPPCGPDFDLRCPRSVRVPAEVVAAVVGAAGEALRNVERYAHAEHVVIQLTGDEAAFTVRISDDGRGFRLEGVRLTSVGLRRSVIGLLEEVGGTATVRSEPGAGTTVELRWTRVGGDLDPPERDRIRGIRTAVGDIRLPLAAVCLPYLMGSAVLAARYSVDSAGMAWLAGWYAVVVLLTVLLLLRGNREVGAGLVLLAAAWSLAGLVLALRIIPADSLDNYASWPIGGLAPLLVVLATVRPPWESVAILVVEEIAIILMLLDGVLVGDDLATLLPPLLSPGLPLVMGLVITATTARLGEVVLGTGEERGRIAMSTAARDSRIVLHQQRITEIGRDILPFLSEVSTGAHRLDDPRVRTRARALERIARDELHIPGVLDRQARDRLETARRNGCVLTIQSDTDLIDPPPMVRTVLVSALDPGLPAPAELTLSLHPHDDPAAGHGIPLLVSLVSVPGNAERSRRLRADLAPDLVSIEDSPEATCVRLVVLAGK